MFHKNKIYPHASKALNFSLFSTGSTNKGVGVYFVHPSREAVKWHNKSAKGLLRWAGRFRLAESHD
jgi:hypothetical protein